MSYLLTIVYEGGRVDKIRTFPSEIVACCTVELLADEYESQGISVIYADYTPIGTEV